MKLSQPVIYAGVFVIVVVAVFLILALAPGKYDALAKCLTEKGAKMYGASWCPHCKDQKEMFGNSWKYVTYVECSTPDGSAETDVCLTANVTVYPTWEFEGGVKHTGLLSFEELSQRTNCPLPG